MTTAHRYVRYREKNAPSNTIAQWGYLNHANQVLPLLQSPFDIDFAAPLQLGKALDLSDVQLLAPVAPSKIIGIGLNYKDHALEQGKPLPQEPYVFIKSLNALNPPNGIITLNRFCTEVHHEAELAVVIGKQCHRISEADAEKYIAGYTIANDVTDRPIQKKELTFARAKGMDSFCPLGPFLAHGIDWKNKSIRLWINGEMRQNGNTDDMVFSVPYLIHFVSQFMTLLPQDVILTGTPKGVGRIQPGDKVKIEIDELGVLENAVASEV